MHDNDTDKNLEASLKSFFRQNRCYDVDELYNTISVKEKEFMNLLNINQRIEFVKIRGMYERYTDLLQQDSFSKGFFEGFNCNSQDV